MNKDIIEWRTFSVKICEDNIPFCPSFKASCGDNAVKKQCPKTCGACSSVGGKYKSIYWRLMWLQVILLMKSLKGQKIVLHNIFARRLLKCVHSNLYIGIKGCKAQSIKKLRDDYRCGLRYPLPNGSPSQCDPKNDVGYCCSPGGWCGATDLHCKCDGCINYRKGILNYVKYFSLN